MSLAMAEPTAPCDLLIVAAFSPELAGFYSLLGAPLHATVGGLVVAARPVGIGLVSAATGMATLLAANRPRAVVLVGTCGAYPGSGLGVGEVIVARSTFLVEPAVLDHEAAFPEPMSALVAAHPAMTAAIGASGPRAARVGTTLAVTTSDALAIRLERASGAAVEHLEAFAVATACEAANVPFAAVLGIANLVGSTGREQWRANHLRAGSAAAAFIARWMEAGAAGIPGGAAP